MRTRFKKSKLTFAERQQAAERRALALFTRRCPSCGALCKLHAGNQGTRARCERCGE